MTKTELALKSLVWPLTYVNYYILLSSKFQKTKQN